MALAASLMIALLSSAVFGAGKGESAKVQSFWKAKSPIIIPVTDKDGTAQLEFPAMPVEKGKLPVVRFKAYLKSSANAGWANCLRIDLNGRIDGSKFRLLNRSPLLSNKDGVVRSYVDNRFLTFIGPGTGEVDARMVTDRAEGYWSLLDISDVVNKVITGWDDRAESQGVNKLTITETLRLADQKGPSICKELVVEDLEVGYLPVSEASNARYIESHAMKPAIGPSITSGDGTITAGKDGALELRIGGESYYYTGMYSYPRSDTIGYNYMGTLGKSAGDWKTSTRLKSKNKEIVVTGNWKNYTVARTIKAENGKFRVYDKITNKQKTPLGMKIRYDAITNAPFGESNVWICGSRAQTGTDNCGTNPSIYISQKKGSAGLVVEDTVFRLQMEVARKENSVTFATNHFGLMPGKSYTLAWTIYPSKSIEYWDFVNRVRRDWGVNFTVQGPWGDEKIIAGRTARLYPISTWFLFHNGAKLTTEQYRALVKPQVDQILAAQPDAIPLGLVETNLIPFNTKTVGGNLPQGTIGSVRKGYGLELTTEQTEYVKKLRWWDSQIKTDDGRGVIDTYYAEAPLSDLLVYPAPGNFQLKYMLWQIDYLMDKVGMKGIYMDDFNLGGRVDQPGRSDYSKWDGHTVDLKPNGEIARKYTDGTLVGAPARATIIRHILDKGGLVVTNGHPVAKETTGLQIHTFAETEWDLSSAKDLLAWVEPPYLPAIAEAHLASPISLGIRPNRFGKFGAEHLAEIIQRWVIACLKNGTLYYNYATGIPQEGPGAGEFGIMNHMFPFTPVELQSGVLVGKERILTAKSGIFHWNHPKKPVVLAFDVKGYQTKPESLEMVKKGTGWQVKLGIKDWLQTAVIEDSGEK